VILQATAFLTDGTGLKAVEMERNPTELLNDLAVIARVLGDSENTLNVDLVGGGQAVIPTRNILYVTYTPVSEQSDLFGGEKE
jgi:hypothetical protein